MAHWNEMRNTIVIAISFYTVMKMICALMFMKSNHYGIICRSNLLQLVSCNVMFKVSDIMV